MSWLQQDLNKAQHIPQTTVDTQGIFDKYGYESQLQVAQRSQLHF